MCLSVAHGRPGIDVHAWRDETDGWNASSAAKDAERNGA